MIWCWIKKEVRDQIGLIVGVLVGLPALTTLAFVYYGGDMAVTDGIWGWRVVAFVPQVVLALALGAEIFGGEVRRETIRFLRRVPGGWGRALQAKCAVLAAASLLLGILQALVLYVGWSLDGRHDLVREVASISMCHVVLAGMALCMFTAWIGTWLPRSGIAGVIAPILLGGLLLPVLWIVREHPYLVGSAQPENLELGLLGTALLSLAVVGLWLSFGLGRRLAARTLRPALIGGATFLTATAFTYLVASAAVEQRLDFAPGSRKLQIHSARLVGDEPQLVVTVSNGAGYFNGAQVAGRMTSLDRSGPGTPMQSWLVALHEPTFRRLDGGAERRLVDVPGRQVPMQIGRYRDIPLRRDAQPVFCLEEPTAATEREIRHWWDAEAGRKEAVQAGRHFSGACRRLLDRLHRWETPHRTKEGAALWLRNGQPVHSLLSPRLAGTDRGGSQPALHVHPMPGGWSSPRPGGGAEFVDLQGARRPHQDWPRGGWEHDAHLAEGLLLSLRQGQHVAARSDGTIVAWLPQPWWVAGPCGDGHVLVCRRVEQAFQWALWDPVRDTRQPLDLARSPTLARTISVARVIGRTGDGRVWAQVVDAVRGGWTEVVYAPLDLEGRTFGREVRVRAKDLYTIGLEGGPRPRVYFYSENTVWVAEAGRDRQRLFPRPGLRELR